MRSILGLVLLFVKKNIIVWAYDSYVPMSFGSCGMLGIELGVVFMGQPKLSWG